MTRRRTPRKLETALATCALLLSACVAGGPPEPDPTGGPARPGGKADDFFSPHAFEYLVTGRTTVTVEEALVGESEEAQLARVRELIGLQHVALAYFLTQYLIDKEPSEAGHGWGGMGGMAKGGDYRDMDIERLDDRTWEYTFGHIVAARADLLEALPLGEGGVGEDELLLVVGAPTNEELAELETDNEWFRRAPWTDWNPSRAAADTPTRQLVVTFSPEEATPDSWFDYPALFEDGVLTIDVHLGYDYHNQYHRRHARALYLWLKNELGFRSPITNFDQLTNTTEPFVSTIRAWGDEVRVEVRLFYGKDGGANDPNTDEGGRALDADLRRSFASADVVLFAGHAGPFYGLSMANWKVTGEGDISYLEIESLQMADRYQVVVADGCDTYQVASAFARNPMTAGGESLDVITTTAYGDAELPYSVMNTILHLIETDPDGEHRPRTIESLLIDLNDANYTNPLYGIHFTADNPTAHPWSDPEWLCEPCDYHYQCGAPGNRCVQLAADETGFCATACTDDSGCPRGYSCEQITQPSAHAIYEMGCVPRDYLCE